ncbi:MAG: cytochrome c biogenesis protein ResB [Chloroflexi bacterium]|nr:cytochrome c biogenesis protein ResB [Chloroflexota bacterium]
MPALPGAWRAPRPSIQNPKSKIQNRAAEHRLALALLGVLAALLLLGAVVPQQGTTPPLAYARWRQSFAPVSFWLEAAGLTASAHAPWLPAVAALLMASLGRCTARRLVALGRGRPSLSRARLARLGSVVFHASLLVGLGAVSLSSAMRFTGQVELAPGQSVVDAPERYLTTRAGPWTPPASGLAVRLDDLRLEAWPDGSLKEQAATLSVLREGKLLARGEVQRSQALAVEGLDILLGSGAGPAVLLAVEEASGSRRGGWVHFPTWPGDGTAELTFAVPQTPVRLAAILERAAPGQSDAAVLTLRPLGDGQATAVQGGPEAATSQAATSQAAALKGGPGAVPGGPPFRAAAQPGAQPAPSSLRLGEATTVGGLRLRFAALEAWTSVAIVRDPFLPWAFGAFWVGLAGLALATLLPKPAGRRAWNRSAGAEGRSAGAERRSAGACPPPPPPEPARAGAGDKPPRYRAGVAMVDSGLRTQHSALSTQHSGPRHG